MSRPLEGRGRFGAALGSVVFLLVAPGVVAGLVPWLLPGWWPRRTPWRGDV